MWFLPDAVRESLASRTPTNYNSPAMVEQARKKAEMERIVNEEGVGTCLYCGLEIRKNSDMVNGGWTWESEDMLGWCDNVKGNKHAPKIIIEGYNG